MWSECRGVYTGGNGSSCFQAELGGIMVTSSDFQSGCLGSSPSRDHYSMRLDRGTGLIRAFIPPG